MTRHLHRFGTLIATLVMLASCSSNKTSLVYFEDIETSQSGEFDAGKYQLLIQPNDELFITVTSLQPEATAPYNIPAINPGTTDVLTQPTGTARQQTYLVSATGDIFFPVLGKLHVAGHTLEGLTEMLTEKISEDVIDPMVTVRLTNFRVQVMGEVNSPRTLYIDRERFSILDALASAGDISPYGRRDNVMIIREQNGKRTYQRINLNDSKVLTSPYFYLQPNDVIVVQPNAIREDNARYNQNNSYKLTVISTVVSAASIIASLVIALTVK